MAASKRDKGEEVGVRRLWRDYSLSIVVGALFLLTFFLHGLFGWWQYAADQAQHGSEASFWGPDGYVVYFGEWTFQNWQSEFLEVYLLIVLTASLIHKGSHESKDGEEEMKASLSRIERRLDQLTEKGS
jgi:succinate dehydrogenase hydrophobic anchor subunit